MQLIITRGLLPSKASEAREPSTANQKPGRQRVDSTREVSSLAWRVCRAETGEVHRQFKEVASLWTRDGPKETSKYLPADSTQISSTSLVLKPLKGCDRPITQSHS